MCLLLFCRFIGRRIFKWLLKVKRKDLCFPLKVEKVKLIRGHNVEFINLGLHATLSGSLVERERERHLFFLTPVSGSAVICLIQAGGALLHHGLGWGFGMRVCGCVCVPGDSLLAVCNLDKLYVRGGKEGEDLDGTGDRET